jgi:hypothetical protein
MCPPDGAGASANPLPLILDEPKAADEVDENAELDRAEAVKRDPEPDSAQRSISILRSKSNKTTSMT